MTDQQQTTVKSKPLHTPYLWREDVLTIFTIAHERQLLTQNGSYDSVEWYLDARGIPYTSFTDHSSVPFDTETLGDQRGLEGRFINFRCQRDQQNSDNIECEYHIVRNPEIFPDYDPDMWTTISIVDKLEE